MDKLINFKKTSSELKKFLAQPIITDRDRAGIIQAFEFTFEQCWKAIQKMAFSQGVEIGSPKTAFVFAMKNSWISSQDEENWLEMIKDRNLTTHTYKEALAKEVVERIQNQYLVMFEKLLAELQRK